LPIWIAGAFPEDNTLLWKVTQPCYVETGFPRVPMIQIAREHTSQDPLPLASDVLNPSTSSGLDETKIGRPGKPLRIFTFAAGGLDCVMQMGTIHALLATGERPDIVLGISIGAINAVALGEVLKVAPDAAAARFDKKSLLEHHTTSAEEIALAKEEAGVSRFLEILEAYREVPAELLRGIRPELSEVIAGNALAPLELPTHFKDERQARKESLRAKTGLIAFLNGLLDCRLPVSAFARFIQLAADVAAAGNIHNRWMRWWQHFLTLGRLWFQALLSVRTLSSTVGRCAWALTGRREFGLDGVQAKTILFRHRWSSLDYARKWLLGAIVILIAPLLAVIAGIYLQWQKAARRQGLPGRTLFDRFLEFFSLKAELGDSYALEQAFVRVFDRNYYGLFSMDSALASGLSGNRNCPQDPSWDFRKTSRTLSEFAIGSEGQPPIHVVPIAANLSTRRLAYLSTATPVIDALMAATALAPIFRARQVGTAFFIDGSNISNEPIRKAMRFLQDNKDRLADGISEFVVYSVTPFPIKSGLRIPNARESQAFTRLTDIAARACELARFRDAQVEQELMGLYNMALPSGSSVWRDDKGETYFRARPVSIAPETALGLNERIPASRSPRERRELVAAAVAEGCRLSLEQFLAEDPTFTRLLRSECETEQKGTISCAKVVGILRRANCCPENFPGMDPGLGPGISEICHACRGERHLGEPGVQLQIPKSWSEKRDTPPETRHSDGEQNAAQKMPPAPSLKDGIPDEKCRRDSYAPCVALLFSGGVFSGVFQIGVANALRMILQRPPRIVAGSSVGSITGCLIAQLFCEEREESVVQMRRLAATYLSLDRFILTDRLADFVGRFTIRAGSAKFSIRDLDLVFRRYEVLAPIDFNNRIRSVTAGLERIFHLSPFALHALARDLRMARHDQVWRRIQDCIQEMLERYGIGSEMLGPEPVSLLLREHVLRRHKAPGTPDKTYVDMPEIASFDIFQKWGIELLATVTNLTEGRLDVLSSCAKAKPRLLDGLLASSAFPGFFRPRWSWEVFTTPSKIAQYSDGGMLDNLPFHSVVDFIEQHQPAKGASCNFPHLIFTASLESEPERWSEKQTRSAAGSWLSVRHRAMEMKFNKKIDDFVRVQRELRNIKRQRTERDEGGQSNPLEIEVLAVKPEWLCGMFGFHPMLGFRRERQAASIAHGCYQTLNAVRNFPNFFADGEPRSAEQKAETERSLVEWGFNVEKLREGLVPRSKEEEVPNRNEGRCWHYPGIECPFSDRSGGRIGEDVRIGRPLNRIYELCRDKRTHSRRAA
jgi:predicted acylesterase/phospholipase RssA